MNSTVRDTVLAGQVTGWAVHSACTPPIGSSGGDSDAGEANQHFGRFGAPGARRFYESATAIARKETTGGGSSCSLQPAVIPGSTGSWTMGAVPLYYLQQAGLSVPSTEY